MGLPARHGALAAPPHPSTGNDEYQLRRAQERVAAHRLDSSTFCRLEERLLDLPTIKSPNLCQHATALSHHASCQVAKPTRGKLPQWRGVDGAALLRACPPVTPPATRDRSLRVSTAGVAPAYVAKAPCPSSGWPGFRRRGGISWHAQSGNESIVAEEGRCGPLPSQSSGQELRRDRRVSR